LGREVESADLDSFAAGRRTGPQIGVVLGRLRRPVSAHGGVYGLALEEERLPALRRFSRAATSALGLPRELAIEDRTAALRLALGLDGPGPGRPVVLDELPYLVAARDPTSSSSIWNGSKLGS